MGAAVQRSYTLEEVEAGLTALAAWRGNSRKASAELAERGITIPWRTLYDWRRNHAERLEEIEQQILPQIRARMAREQEEIASEAAQAALKVIRRTAEKVDEIEPRDLPGAARNLEVTSATAIDKHAILHGLPTEIRETGTAEDIMKRLASKHPGMFVDGTAEEIPDAEVVEEKPEGRAERESLAKQRESGSPAEGAERQLSRTSSHPNAHAQKP